jgi:hypothetical protein
MSNEGEGQMSGQGNFHNEKMETAPLKDIRELQARRLKEVVSTASPPRI